jgi:putative ABC transport system permease protein
MGLFGLVEYSVNQRAKEISIRKVFGASLVSVLVLLTRQYFFMLSIACVLIVPVSYYAANQWLSSFAYHVNVDLLIFLEAAAIIFSITASTVSFQSVKAALTNPVENLKND